MRAVGRRQVHTRVMIDRDTACSVAPLQDVDLSPFFLLLLLCRIHRLFSLQPPNTCGVIPVSIVLLIDGYNVIAPVAAPGRGSTLRWLETERRRLLDRLSEHLDEIVRERTCVVFDAKSAPPGQPSRFFYQAMEIRFATEYPEADDLLEELISGHPAPRGLSVVSSDHRIQAAARRKRAGVFDSDPWLDRLLDGYIDLIRYPKVNPKRLGTPNRKPSARGEKGGSPAPQQRPFAKPHFQDASDVPLDTMLSDDELAEMIRRHQA